MIDVAELIKRKRDGAVLSREEIDFLINGYTVGHIPDFQMAAWLMTVFYRGMTERECTDLTMAMAESGDMVDLSSIKKFTLDKHSTGGVGDTTTLVLAPLIASAGGVMAKMTGRELGHTGGTVDKLESIPGLTMELSQEQFLDIVSRIGVSVIAQSDRLAPADKLIYSLRSLTATVDSIPLIAASIMSKKLAAGAKGIVLDVKTGSGAFMTRREDAVALARTMVDIGRRAGRLTSALITSMEQPLGRAVGNALEAAEAIEVLSGRGPDDLRELVLWIGAEMLLTAGLAEDRDAGREQLLRRLNDGSALAKFGQLIAAQGGDAGVIVDPCLLPQAKEIIPIPAPNSGWLTGINALEVGLASKILGVGRLAKNQAVDPSVGLVLQHKIGDRVEAGQPLALFHTDGDPTKIEEARTRFNRAISIGPAPIEPPTLVLARVTAEGVEEIGFGH